MSDTPRTDAALAMTFDSCGFLDEKVHGPLTDVSRALEHELALTMNTLIEVQNR